jgi:hypothetical protein
VVRTVRNRIGMDVGRVPDLGAHLAALADQGLLEQRRPSGRPIVEYRLAPTSPTRQACEASHEGPTTLGFRPTSGLPPAHP